MDDRQRRLTVIIGGGHGHGPAITRPMAVRIGRAATRGWVTHGGVRPARRA